MKKQLTFFLFSLVLGAYLQNCKYAKIDSIANTSFEVGFTTIKAKGHIIDYKDGTPTAHGHCYSLKDEIPEIGLAETDTTETPYVDVDFESKIDTLFFDKEYFVRPYMRNGDKIVYGEVQKISTKTPRIIIDNFLIKRDSINPTTIKDFLEASCITNEPLIVPNPLITRQYGLLFCKAPNVSELSISSGVIIPTGTNIINMPLTPSPLVLERRNISLNIQLNDPLNPTNQTFFSAVAGTDYYVRAYVKLNRGDIVKYYYSDLITLLNQPPSPLKFRIK